MRHFGMLFVVTSVAVSLTGCGQMGFSTPTARGGMAVVDLDKVAAETGRDRQLTQSLELAQNSLNQSLAKSVESANEQLNAKKKTYGEDLTEDEKKEFSAMERSAVNQLSQIQNRAKAEFEQFKQKQIAQFRAELKPIAHEIAMKRGLSIVIPKNEGLLLSVDSGIDITDEVVKALRKDHPVPTTPAPVAAPAVEQAAAPAKPAAAKRNSSSAKSAARTADSEGDQEQRR
jgi:Skp family chaperone for outer membrane proteins